MKTFGKIVVFTLIAVVFSGAIFLVGQTRWADGVREKVNQKRAERRAKTEAANRPDGSAAQTPIPSLPDTNKSLDNRSRNADDAPPTAENARRQPKETAKNDASVRKAPGPKPPQIGVQAFAAFGGYFAQLAIAALVSGLFLAGVRRCNTSPKRVR